MKILSYIKSLLPRFGKDRMVEDARIALAELQSVTLPSYREAEKFFDAHRFESEEAKNVEAVFARSVKMGRGENLVSAIRKGLEKTIEFHKVIEEAIDDKFQEDVVIGGVTVLKLNVLRSLEMITFSVRYAAKLLNYLYIVETAAIGGDDRYIRNSLSPAEIEWVQKALLDFTVCFGAITKSRKEVATILESLPDVVIGEDSLAAVATLGEARVDPFNIRLMSGFSSSPIYRIRMIVAEYQANKYKQGQELKTVLELRLLNLQSLVDQTPNASIERQIDYTQSRIDKLGSQLRKVEESVE